MSHGKVEAARGAGWIRDAFALVMTNPGVFAVMALILAVLEAIPLLNLAMVVLGPALFGGFLWAMREQDRGRKAELQHLFVAFQMPGKLGPMITLCLPAVAAMVVFGVIVFLWIGTAFMGYAVSGNKPESALLATGMGVGAFLGIVVMVAVAFSLYALMFYAVPRVMFEGREPVAALKESMAATRDNIGAMLLFAGAFWLLCVLGFMVLSVAGRLGWLLWDVVVSALAAGSVYAAYRDVFGAASADVPPPAAPEPPSAA